MINCIYVARVCCNALVSIKGAFLLYCLSINTLKKFTWTVDTGHTGTVSWIHELMLLAQNCDAPTCVPQQKGKKIQSWKKFMFFQSLAIADLGWEQKNCCSPFASKFKTMSILGCAFSLLITIGVHLSYFSISETSKQFNYSSLTSLINKAFLSAELPHTGCFFFFIASLWGNSRD